MIENGEFKLSDLAQKLADAPAGQSNALSCLMWAFEKYGRIEPPREGFHAYQDPEGEVVDALMSLARVAADYFGYEVRA